MIKSIKMFMLSVLMFGTVASADEKLKLLFIGQPQSGPPMSLLNAYAQELDVPHEVVLVKDCAAALRVIDQNSNVVWVTESAVYTNAMRIKENCVPNNLTAEQLIAQTISSWHLCHLPDQKKKFGQGSFTMGILATLPVKEIAKDFNEKNGMEMKGVGLLSSGKVSAALLAGDVEFGMVNPAVSEPLMAEGKLTCEMTFLPQGQGTIGADKYVGNFYKMKIPLYAYWWIGAKTDNKNTNNAVYRALRGSNFEKYLNKGGWTSNKLNQKFTDKDWAEYETYAKDFANAF